MSFRLCDVPETELGPGGKIANEEQVDSLVVGTTTQADSMDHFVSSLHVVIRSMMRLISAVGGTQACLESLSVTTTDERRRAGSIRGRSASTRQKRN